MANRRGRVMIVTDVHHLNIATQDLALTVAFYTDILGLVDGPRPNFPSKGHWLYVGDRSLIHVQVARAPVVASSASALNHFALRVADLDVAVARLKTHGVVYRLGESADNGTRQVFLEDPNGVLIELNAT